MVSPDGVRAESVRLDEPPGPRRDHDESPAGLEPAAWYPEPTARSAADELPPAGLEPVAWYPEPGAAPGPDPDPREAPAGAGRPGPGGEATPYGSGTGGSRADPRSGFAAPVEPSGSGDIGRPLPPSAADAGEATFDTEALFREPAPSDRFGGGHGGDLEQMSPDGGVAVNWEPAAADAWDVPVDPEGKPKRQAVLSRESRLLLAGIIVSLLAVVAVATFREREVSHPSEWATSVQQMADWVSKTRKLPFEHPVTVTTLNGSDYDAAVANAGRPDDEKLRQELADQVAMWRALGAVQGNPSARLHAVTAQRPELGAFYDLERKRLVLRDGSDLARLREGLAGALSVALDDQRAKLGTLRSTGIDENPRFDVVLGTAALMRSDYARGHELTDPAQTVPSDDAQTDGTSAFLEMRPELQARLGEPFVQLVRDVDGVEAADALAPSPPVSSQQVMMPTAYFDGRGPLVSLQPTVPDGAEALGEGTLGAQTWYLLLAAHLEDPAAVNDALAFADRWAGDSYVAYRDPAGKVCVTDTLRGSDESATALLTIALRHWADTVPGGQIQVEAEGTDRVTVTGCDPGASADRGLQTTLDTAIAAAATRSELAANYYRQGTRIPNGVNGPVFEPPVAWCMGAEAVALAQPDQLAALAARREPTYRDLTLAAAGRCNSNMADQLFVDRGD